MLAHVSTPIASVDADVLTIAVALLVGGIGTLILATVLADRRGSLPHGDVPFGRWIAMVVAGLSVGAASIHFAVIGEHFAEYPPYGVAFVALAWFQVGWAVAYVLAPDRLAGVAAILVNAGALLVWAASRSVGLPVGPEPWQVEPLGSLDMAAGALEIALIVVLAWGLGAVGRQVRPALPRAGAVIVLGSSALAVVLLTTVAFVVAGGDPHGGAAAAPFGPETLDTPTPAPSSKVDVEPATAAPAPSGLVPSPSPVSSSASAPASVSRSPQPPPDRATLAPPTPGPTQSPTAPPPASPGAIRFGTSLDADGEIAVATDRFGEGQSVVWVADFVKAPNTQNIRWVIVQVLPDGREFEHWREEIALADPSSRRLIGGADLSIYLHGGDGSYRMRYVRGTTLLAEGAFDFVP